MIVSLNLDRIQNKIRQACERSGRNPEEITLIGVTKYATIERTKETITAGVKNLGENRAEELLHKYEGIKSDKAHWHFIGTLQSRKVKDIINKVDTIHSLDRESLAKQINRRTENPMDCFVQVNVSGEKSKHGLHPDDVVSFVERLSEYENIRVVGLMTMAPHVEDEQIIRETFIKLRQLRDKIKEKQYPFAPCSYLSMGMSQDYEIAIEEGATHIRIGSQLVIE